MVLLSLSCLLFLRITSSLTLQKLVGDDNSTYSTSKKFLLPLHPISYDSNYNVFNENNKVVENISHSFKLNIDIAFRRESEVQPTCFHNETVILEQCKAEKVALELQVQSLMNGSQVKSEMINESNLTNIDRNFNLLSDQKSVTSYSRNYQTGRDQPFTSFHVEHANNSGSYGINSSVTLESDMSIVPADFPFPHSKESNFLIYILLFGIVATTIAFYVLKASKTDSVYVSHETIEALPCDDHIVSLQASQATAKAFVVDCSNEANSLRDELAQMVQYNQSLQGQLQQLVVEKSLLQEELAASQRQTTIAHDVSGEVDRSKLAEVVDQLSRLEGNLAFTHSRLLGKNSDARESELSNVDRPRNLSRMATPLKESSTCKIVTSTTSVAETETLRLTIEDLRAKLLAWDEFRSKQIESEAEEAQQRKVLLASVNQKSEEIATLQNILATESSERVVLNKLKDSIANQLLRAQEESNALVAQVDSIQREREKETTKLSLTIEDLRAKLRIESDAFADTSRVLKLRSDEILEVRRSLSSEEEQRNDMLITIEQKSKEIIALRNSLASEVSSRVELAEAKDTIAAKLAAIEGEVTSLSAQIESLRFERANEVSELSFLREQSSFAAEDLFSATVELSNSRQIELNEKISCILVQKASIDELEEQLSLAEDSRMTLRSCLVGVEQEVKARDDIVQNLNARINSLSEELVAERKERQEYSSVLEKTLESNEFEIRRLLDRVNELERLNENLTAAVNEQTEKKEATLESLNELNVEKGKLRVLLSEKDYSLRNAIKEIQETTAKLTKQQVKCKELSDTTSRLEQQLENREATIQFLESTEKGILYNELQATKAKLAEAQLSLESLNSSCQANSTAMVDLQSRFKHFQSKIEVIKSGLEQYFDAHKATLQPFVPVDVIDLSHNSLLTPPKVIEERRVAMLVASFTARSSPNSNSNSSSMHKIEVDSAEKESPKTEAEVMLEALTLLPGQIARIQLFMNVLQKCVDSMQA